MVAIAPSYVMPSADCLIEADSISVNDRRLDHQQMGGRIIRILSSAVVRKVNMGPIKRHASRIA